jgi:hypothetical protein
VKQKTFPGNQVTIERKSMSDELKLRRLLYQLDDRGRAVISRAILLKQALSGQLGDFDLADDGVALVEIVTDWLGHQATRLAEKGPGCPPSESFGGRWIDSTSER